MYNETDEILNALVDEYEHTHEVTPEMRRIVKLLSPQDQRRLPPPLRLTVPEYMLR